MRGAELCSGLAYVALAICRSRRGLTRSLQCIGLFHPLGRRLWGRTCCESPCGLCSRTSCSAVGRLPQRESWDPRWDHGAQPILPVTTPSQMGQFIFLAGPMYANADISLLKSIPIYEKVRFTIYVEFLNAFNHPNWKHNGQFLVRH